MKLTHLVRISPRLAVAILIGLGLNPAHAAAQDACAPIQQVIDAAPSEFAAFYGNEIDGDFPAQITGFESTHKLSANGSCSIAEVVQGDARFSTSYTCSFPTDDLAGEVARLKTQLSECLDVRDWTDQTAPNAPTVLLASYGLLRLSISHHETGPGFGVEVFRDQNGQVAGSSVRGNQTGADGRQSCTPKAQSEINAAFRDYATRTGAELTTQDQFYVAQNRQSAPLIAFITRPSHPAHPAIITRDVKEIDGSVVMTASGDFAGDCLAFQRLLNEVRQMNESVGE